MSSFTFSFFCRTNSSGLALLGRAGRGDADPVLVRDRLENLLDEDAVGHLELREDGCGGRGRRRTSPDGMRQPYTLRTDVVDVPADVRDRLGVRVAERLLDARHVVLRPLRERVVDDAEELERRGPAHVRDGGGRSRRRTGGRRGSAP